MPATKIAILTLCIEAATAISECQAVGYDGAVAGTGGSMKGLAISDASPGDQAGVDVLGTSIAIAGGPIDKGTALQVGDDGKLVEKTDGIAVARAEQDAVSDGDLIEVFLLAN